MTLEPRMWIADCSKCNGRWAGHVKPAYSNPVEYVRTDEVEALIAAAVLAEREACAKIANEIGYGNGTNSEAYLAGRRIAAAIMTRNP